MAGAEMKRTRTSCKITCKAVCKAVCKANKETKHEAATVIGSVSGGGGGSTNCHVSLQRLTLEAYKGLGQGWMKQLSAAITRKSVHRLVWVWGWWWPVCRMHGLTIKQQPMWHKSKLGRRESAGVERHT
eukprot:15080689-Ditylum_brightwellii.AAC.1